MNEQRQKELKELIAKHQAAPKIEGSPPGTETGGVFISDVSGNHNNFYVNSNITAETAKKN